MWNPLEIEIRVFSTGQTLILMEIESFHLMCYFLLTFQTKCEPIRAVSWIPFEKHDVRSLFHEHTRLPTHAL